MEKVLSFLNHEEVLKEKQDKKQTSNKNKIKMLKIFADLMSVYSCWIIMIESAARDEYERSSLLACESLKATC